MSVDLALLRAVLDAMIPPDADPGATDLDVDRFVVSILARERTTDEPVIREGLTQLGAGFLALDAGGRAQALEPFAREPWFVLLAELAAEGYYADPGNGGNRCGRSWEMIGYEARLPEPLLGRRH